MTPFNFDALATNYPQFVCAWGGGGVGLLHQLTGWTGVETIGKTAENVPDKLAQEYQRWVLTWILSPHQPRESASFPVVAKQNHNKTITTAQHPPCYNTRSFQNSFESWGNSRYSVSGQTMQMSYNSTNDVTKARQSWQSCFRGRIHQGKSSVEHKWRYRVL